MEVFGFFNEVGIINQLSSALLADCLPDGVHPSHFAIINHLVRMGDGKSPLRIANAMQVTKNTMTHSLKVLTDRGFVSVVPDPKDGRAKIVTLTDAGRAFRETAIQRVLERFSQIFAPEHAETMRRIQGDLASIRKLLDDNR
ncbi:MAG: MarR family transcriptional regulator [Pseudomonadota bacterium]